MDKTIIKQGEYEGFEFFIRKLALGGEEYLCGYVVIPKDHKYYDAYYEEIENDIDVHGGLTYSGIQKVYSITKGKEELFVLGFDCHHSEDNIKEQNEEYVIEQCKHLIDQL